MGVTFGDEYFMGLALAEARCAADEGEIPVGAVVVAGDRILGKGHNHTERLHDITEATLYVTVEPCPMCAGAIGWSQLRRIVIGAPDPKRGYAALLRPGASFFHPKAEVITGVRAEECAALMRDFFLRRRQK